MCDISEARLKHLRTLYPEVEGETDFNHMLNGAGLDAVVIATAVKYHFPMAKAACSPASTPSSKSRWPPPPQSARN